MSAMRVSQTQAPNAETTKAIERARASRVDEQKKDSKESQEASKAAEPTISPKAREMAKAKEVAQSAAEVRAEKIAELRRRIENNDYNVNAEAVADKMIKEHREL